MRKLSRDRGATSVEYALLALFIGIAALIAITMFGGAVLHLFDLGNTVVTPGPGH
jgi:Flp pilus assembly pilin Flp